MNTHWQGFFPALTSKFRSDLSLDTGALELHIGKRIDSYTAPNRYGVAADGQEFLINIPVDEEVSNPVTVSVHLFE